MPEPVGTSGTRGGSQGSVFPPKGGGNHRNHWALGRAEPGGTMDMMEESQAKNKAALDKIIKRQLPEDGI